MQQNALIQIKGIQYQEGDSDIVELTTVGSFYKKNGAYFICYDESEATGFDGSRTMLKVEDGNRVTMQRTGTTQSQLIIEKGMRHQCHYDTGYGDLIMGVSCDKIHSSLDTAGGKLHFKYTLDLNASMASQNEVFVSVARTSGKRKPTPPAVAAAPAKPEAAPAEQSAASKVRPVRAAKHGKHE